MSDVCRGKWTLYWVNPTIDPSLINARTKKEKSRNKVSDQLSDYI